MTATLRGLIKRYSKSILATVCVIGSISAAHAQNGASSGQVGSVLVLGAGAGAPNGLDFRVTLAGAPVICNGQTFAYVNQNDVSYDAIMANVLEARALGVAITFNWTQSSAGYCYIDYVSW